jgi:hypothetical protein
MMHSQELGLELIPSSSPSSLSSSSAGAAAAQLPLLVDPSGMKWRMPLPQQRVLVQALLVWLPLLRPQLHHPLLHHPPVHPFRVWRERCSMGARDQVLPLRPCLPTLLLRRRFGCR